MPRGINISYFDQALKLLSHRPHAEKELRFKLENLSKKRYYRRSYKNTKESSSSVFLNEATPKDDQQEIDDAIQKLKAEGYLNDYSFTEWYCMQRQEYNPRSERVLYSELLMKGVNPSIIKEVLKEVYSEEESCRDVALRKMNSMTYDKLKIYLFGKGFHTDIVKKVLKEVSNSSSPF